MVYVGEKGTLMQHRLIPESAHASIRPAAEAAAPVARPPRGMGDRCRGGPPAGSNFVDHAGLLTEACLLGNVAVRAQKKLDWDGVNMKITNDEAANQYLHREYRSGWTL